MQNAGTYTLTTSPPTAPPPSVGLPDKAEHNKQKQTRSDPVGDKIELGRILPYPLDTSGRSQDKDSTVNQDTSCTDHPSSSNSVASAPFFHGTTPLFRRRRDVSEVCTLCTVHRVLLFRGEVFEWGVGADDWESKVAWEGHRCPSDCQILWANHVAGYSTCTREQAEQFTRDFKARYGTYNLFTNNCHHFVNRLMNYLDSGCAVMPY
ncbi:Hypp4724 [Branchiostoma lanceolatum]|uniref:Hypp4724 protein n=1 Tax=Branchiostoma lanceolatum TaxID=7740 RepID=A0A8K0F218_BRALA|nr:Hypp4724 [Branchiostoma lanceolatum]